MKILITGGCGFIGSHLEPALKGLGDEVYLTDRIRVSGKNYLRGDICDYIRMEEIFDEVRPDVVYHFAGMVSRKECEETPQLAIQTNALGTMNIIRLCQKGYAKIVYAGSSEEYGSAFDGGNVVTEESPLGTPSSIYSATKRMADELIEYHTIYKGLFSTRFRFFMFYGGGEPANEYRSAISRFMDAAIKGEPMHVHRNTERSWCHIDDGIMALVAARDRGDGKLYNIGRDEPILTTDLALKIRAITGSNSQLVLENAGETIIPVKRASFAKAEKELGWKSIISLDEGLNRLFMESVAI